MKITGKTRITGLFGYPVEHTLSPLMHNAAFEHLGLDYCYLPFRVATDDLGQAVDAIRALNLAGVNVTVPHKESVMRYLDHIDTEASFIGAVNTVVNDDGRLSGFNTDGRGFMASLAEAGISTEGKQILIVGTGGACRAIGYYLSEKGAALSLFDLDREKAKRLTGDLSAIRENVVVVEEPVDPGRFDVVINATPLGLKKDDPLPMDVSRLGPGHTVCDLIYRRTPLLKAAAERGCRTLDGLGMLLWQGILAFELWTKTSPPVEVMRSALLKGMAP